MLKIDIPSIEIPTDVTTYIDSKKPFKGGEWEDKNKKIKLFKKNVKTFMEHNQKAKCAFCGSSFGVTSDSEIEHIAPKGGKKNPQHVNFTFEILNLVLACHLCNGFSKKGNYDTILFYDDYYVNCEFKIVHPYLDDVEKHFEFVEKCSVTDPNGLIVQGKSEKAEESIRLFKLNSIELIKDRFKESLYYHTGISKNRQAQIGNIIAYKSS